MISLKMYFFPITNRTRIAKPPSSWIDDYIDWLNLESCCKMYENGTFCPSNSM